MFDVLLLGEKVLTCPLFKREGCTLFPNDTVLFQSNVFILKHLVVPNGCVFEGLSIRTAVGARRLGDIALREQGKKPPQ